jgi:hypothetical protein
VSTKVTWAGHAYLYHVKEHGCYTDVCAVKTFLEERWWMRLDQAGMARVVMP